MVLEIASRSFKTIFTGFLRDSQLDLFGDIRVEPNLVNLGHYFASVVHNFIGMGELETLISRGFTPGMKKIGFFPDIYIPDKAYVGARKFVECKFSSHTNSIPLRPEQMLAYLQGHYREISKQGPPAEVYFALGRYKDYDGGIKTADFGDILEHLTQNMTDSIILPQYALFNHAIGLDGALQDRTGRFTKLPKAKLSKLLQGDLDTIEQELEGLRGSLQNEGVYVPDRLFRTIKVKEYETKPRDLEFEGKKFRIKPFKIRVAQDTNPGLYTNFLSQMSPAPWSEDSLIPTNYRTLERLITGDSLEIMAKRQDEIDTAARAYDVEENPWKYVRGPDDPSVRTTFVGENPEAEIRRLYGIPDRVPLEEFAHIIEDIGGGNQRYLN